MNINDRKYQVFISSTFKDLEKARAEVIRVLLNIYQIPIGMEMFSAGNDEQWKVIKDTIDGCDYYILIIGHRYGSTTDEGISYTEKEFNYALEVGVPVMVFVRRDDVATTPAERDANPELIEKLNAFRTVATSNRMVNFWTTIEELGQQVQAAIFKAPYSHPRPGWIRADQAASPQVISELAALSSENRELKKENEQLKTIQNSRRPALRLLINGEESLRVTYQEQLEGHYPTIEPIYSANDFPASLSDYYDAEEVEKYNDAIARSQSVVDEYNRKTEMVRRIIETKFPVKFAVENMGTTKANEVFVELHFPPELSILDEEATEETNVKAPAFIPENPISRAADAHNLIARPSSFFSRLATHAIPQKNFLSPKRNFTVNGQLLTINLDTLLHTRKRTTNNELFIIPLSRGVHKIQVKFICEEWEAQETDEFEVVVE